MHFSERYLLQPHLGLRILYILGLGKAVHKRHVRRYAYCILLLSTSFSAMSLAHSARMTSLCRYIKILSNSCFTCMEKVWSLGVVTTAGKREQRSTINANQFHGAAVVSGFQITLCSSLLFLKLVVRLH